MDEKMTKAECFQVLDRYKNWNTGQKSNSLAFDGVRDEVEDEIYDEQRRLILAATKRLCVLCGKGERTLVEPSKTGRIHDGPLPNSDEMG